MQCREDALYVPLRVGAEGKKPFRAARDNEGENISEKDPGYCGALPTGLGTGSAAMQRPTS